MEIEAYVGPGLSAGMGLVLEARTRDSKFCGPTSRIKVVLIQYFVGTFLRSPLSSEQVTAKRVGGFRPSLATRPTISS